MDDHLVTGMPFIFFNHAYTHRYLLKNPLCA